MKIAEVVAERSTCLRRKVGAVLVKDKHLIASGYNGSVVGAPHCQTCFREDNNIPSGERYETCYSVHAEQNCIIQAAIHGSGVKNAEMYITYAPCNICAKMIVNAGIWKVTFKGEFPDPMAKEILK